MRNNRRVRVLSFYNVYIKFLKELLSQVQLHFRGEAEMMKFAY